jgi:hypothetical protein
MIHRRGVLPVLVLLALVVFGLVGQIVRGSGTATPAGQSAAATPAPVTGAGREALRSLAAVERAYDAGNVRRLCRPGVLVDPAVIRAQNAAKDGCEGEVEGLMANVPRLHVTVRALAVESDLVTADVAAANGAAATVDFVHRDGRWLLSFSDGTDPLPALAGTS